MYLLQTIRFKDISISKPVDKQKIVDKENLNKAVSAALLWLNDCDLGNYKKCWENGSVYFKNAITEEDLLKALTVLRTPLGKVLS